MPSVIVKLDGKYLEWSSVVDAPTTYGMTRDAFEVWYRDKYGRVSMVDFERRMARVEAKGTSCMDASSVDELVAGNRAGVEETELSMEQIVEHYVHRRCELPLGRRIMDGEDDR